MSDPATISLARTMAGIAICEHIDPGEASACGACQAKADQAVAQFLRSLAEGPPRYVMCRRSDGSAAHVWVTPHDLDTLAQAVKA